jgi:hypothetical protein
MQWRRKKVLSVSLVIDYFELRKKYRKNLNRAQLNEKTCSNEKKINLLLHFPFTSVVESLLFHTHFDIKVQKENGYYYSHTLLYFFASLPCMQNKGNENEKSS